MYAENLPDSEYWDEDATFEKQAENYQIQFQNILHKYQSLMVKESMVSIEAFNKSY